MLALKYKMSEKQKGCVNPANDNDGRTHESVTTVQFTSKPAVFLFNLQWNGEPTSMQILKVLVSLPETFESSDLFQDNYPTTYTIKGLICFQAAHYLAFYRRIPIKLNLHSPKDQQKILREASESEWTLFDDESVSNMGQWQDVIDFCVSYSCYPTVVLFERFDEQQVVQTSHELDKS